MVKFLKVGGLEGWKMYDGRWKVLSALSNDMVFSLATDAQILKALVINHKQMN